MDWSESVSKITPFVVEIQTQSGRGTGFVFWQKGNLCCIATAKHVIEPANIPGWEQPIYIYQPDGTSFRLNPTPDSRRIVDDLNKDIGGDSAAILISKDKINIPSECLPLWDFSRELGIGAEIGWLGYPQIVSQQIRQPSFFSGNISNIFAALEQYTIDGVAIHGVSGGPVFCKNSSNATPAIIGTISSYFPNPIHSERGVDTWPGIALSHNFLPFIPLIKDLDNLEQAHRKDEAEAYVKDVINELNENKKTS
jgi:hypothetical protein